MSILFLSRLFYPHIGGVETHVEKLFEVFLEKGNKVIIITEQYREDLPLKEDYKNITVYRIPVAASTEKQKKWVIWKWIWINRKLFFSANVVHVHDVLFWIYPIVFLLKYKAKKIFITYHGYEGSSPPRFSAIFQRKLGEVLSNGTICVGGFMKKWYKAKPTKIVYGAAEKVSTKIFKKSSNFKAAYLGRLSKDAGITMYLDAIRILKEEGRVIVLDVYGDGEEYQVAFEFAEKHGLTVNFHGFVGDARERISVADFVFVSRYLGILEAMLLKKTVFAVYDNEIKKDYLTCHPQQDNMIIAGDSATLATYLREVVSNPIINTRKSEIAYLWAKEQTWSKLAQDYEDLWNLK